VKRILALCVALLFLLAAGCGSKSKTYSKDSPEGVVQAYYQALKDRKYEEAYGYLKAPWPVSKEEYVKGRKSSGMTFKAFTVGKAQVQGDSATVPVQFKTGVSSMPEVTLNINLVKDKSWRISDLGMGGKSGHGSGTPPAGMSPAGGMPPAGGMGGTVPGSANPHGPGGSIPLDK